MTTRRQRITVREAQLVVQPAAEAVDLFQALRFGELLTALSMSPEDRSIGRRRYEVVVDGWRFEVSVEGAARAELRDKALSAAADHHVASDVMLRAQIPGRVARVWVTEGQRVEQGERLLAIEAMKMENEIRAPHSGTVRGIKVEPGGRVEREDELLTVDG